MNGIVAVVGRPNVGKSTLFNRIVGKRMSIVDDTPGVTRDRIYAKAEWLGKEFMLVDTGGIEPDSKDVILSQMRMQAQLAIDKADVIIFVTDVTSGVTANDADVAAMLQKSGKPVVLCVNKCDGIGEVPPEFYEFYNLGLGDPIAVSSVHGHGTGDLLDAVFENMPEENPQREYSEDAIKVAVIGKPNAGKSSLVNKIAGEQRMIVSNIAGTTRDAVDTVIERDGQEYVLIDTAGIRRKSKVNEQIEKYSVLRAYMAVDRADVCVIMIDATEGFTEQDSKVAGYAHEQGKASVIAINKWDAVEKDGKIYGRGTADDKGPAIAALYAMRAVKELGIPLKKNVRLILGTDEECGSSDIEYYYSKEPEAPMTFSPDIEYPVVNVEKGRLPGHFTMNFEVSEALPRLVSLKCGTKINVVPGKAKAVVEGFEDGVLETAAKAAEEKTGVHFTMEAKDGAVEITAEGKGANSPAWKKW